MVRVKVEFEADVKTNKPRLRKGHSLAYWDTSDGYVMAFPADAKIEVVPEVFTPGYFRLTVPSVGARGDVVWFSYPPTTREDWERVNVTVSD